MLSDHEQRVWEAIERFWVEDAEEPMRPGLRTMRRRRRRPRALVGLPAIAVAGALGSVLLFLLGALVAGLAVGLATVLGWALWHCWPVLSEQGEAGSSVLGERLANRGDGARER